MSLSTNTTKAALGREVAIRLFNLHVESVKLYQAYVQLETGGRQEVEDLLLRHIHLLNGMNPYSYWGRWNEVARRTSFLLLLNKASEEIAKAWYDWAVAISKTRTSPVACRDAVLYMVRQFVMLKFMEAPLSSGSLKKVPQRGGKLMRN